MKKIPPYKTRILRRSLVVGLFIIISSISIYLNNKKSKNIIQESNTLKTILERDTLIALTNCNSTSYFSYRGTPMGFQHDMLSLFADFLNVELRIIINNDIETAFKMLNNSKCDLVAMDLSVTKERSKKVSFSTAYGQTRQVLIQRKPNDWKKKSDKDLNSYLIRNQLDLANKKIHVQRNSVFAKRLKSLSNEIGAEIDIIEIDNYDIEQLIRLVALGEIDYTIADENIAKLNQTYYSNIDFATPISFPQKIAWAAAKNSDSLITKLNSWFHTFTASPIYTMLYDKYFNNRKAVGRFSSPYMSIRGGKISPYDKIIKKYSKIPKYDWRLVASLIYQESRFNTQIVSWAGAFGIMQLMPGTASYFGINQNSSLQSHIKAGCKLLAFLDNRFKESIPDKNERIKFVLASYNCGQGHIEDARRLAKKYGHNPNVWDTQVDSFLLWKSDSKYYLDTVVRHGYCRGQEPFDYVKEITNRYEHYKNVIQLDGL